MALAEDFVGLIETSRAHALEAQLAVMKIAATNKQLIVLSTTLPCANIRSLLQKNNIPADNVFIFDTVGTEHSAKSKNVVFFDKSALTSISIELEKHIATKGPNAFVLIDSVTNLLMNNQPGDLFRFIAFLITRVRINKACCLLIFAEKDNRIKNEVMQLCDKVIVM